MHGGKTLRETALAAIAATSFYPEGGRNRIRSMVESRPDWLISRQRAWGSPLAIFVDKDTGEVLRDEAVNARIRDHIAAEGADAWFTRPASDFLGDHDPERFEKVEDILDVWFDSGSTHAFMLEGRNDTRWPADLYLEGSDQHRGWFQSSLLESSGTRGRAPYDAILTHGFTMDEAGEKMSKSKGNTVDPQTVIAQSGAEIIRLWAASIDYAEDSRIGQTILPPPPTPIASCATPSATCWARWPASRTPSGWSTRRCRRWSGSSCTGCSNSMARCARPMSATTSRPSRARCSTSARTSSRPCSSTSAATPSTATGRIRCAAAPAAR